jgi:hypothetical protein
MKPNLQPVELGTRQSLLERFLDVGARYRGDELPRQDVAGAIVQHRGRVLAALAPPSARSSGGYPLDARRHPPSAVSPPPRVLAPPDGPAIFQL